MNYSDEHVALCALNKIFGYHPALATTLIEKAGSAVACFSGDYVPETPDLSVIPGPDRGSPFPYVQKQTLF